MKIQRTVLEPYGRRLVMIDTDDLPKLLKYLKRLGCTAEVLNYMQAKDQIYAHTLSGSVLEVGIRWHTIFVVFNSKGVEKIGVGVLAHEARHISNFIYQAVGVEPDIHNDESDAYFLGYVAETLATFLRANGWTPF